MWLSVKPAQLVAAFSADAENLDLFSFAQKLIDQLPRTPDDVGVESAAQSAIRCCDDQKLHLLRAGAGQQFRRARIVLQRARQRGNHRRHLLGIGPRRLRRILRPLQFRCRHHLHGARDLARGLHAGDAVAECFQARHCFRRNSAKIRREWISAGSRSRASAAFRCGSLPAHPHVCRASGAEIRPRSAAPH